MSALIGALAQLIHTVINIYIWVIIISALFSFVRPDPYNPLVKIINQLTEPVFRWVRRTMPFVVLSNMDLSPVVVLLALQFADTLVYSAAF